MIQNLQESLFSSWLVCWNRFPFWVYFLQSFPKALLLYSSTICQWEISEVSLWAVSLICLHDFTLFVADIHQIMLISLFLTPFDHFHFHGSVWLILWYDLRLWHNKLNLFRCFILHRVGALQTEIKISLWFSQDNTTNLKEVYFLFFQHCLTVC